MTLYMEIIKRHEQQHRKELNVWGNLRKRQKRAVNRAQKSGQHGNVTYTIVSAWRNFEVFLQDMGPAPSAASFLARHDPSKPWCKQNCYWAEHSAEFLEGHKAVNEITARKSQAVLAARRQRHNERMLRRSAT